MAVLFTDAEIAELVAEPKALPADYHTRLVLRAKRGHKEQELLVRGSDEHEFHLILRQSTTDALDFSVIQPIRLYPLPTGRIRVRSGPRHFSVRFG